jgi:uncharacterized cupin superfamily protein
MPDDHPNLIRWDAVESRSMGDGELRGLRTKLGAAAGAARIGVSRYRLGPGERAMPVHVHADEEELFYVLGGSGLSWQDGSTYRVAAGDMLVHLAGGAAHTIMAGPDGLDVLAFGSGSDTGMTWLPRAKAWWMGPHWLPDDAPDPFEREAGAGPLELPEPEPERPPISTSVADAPSVHTDRPGYRETFRDLGRAAGSVLSGIKHCELEPGQLSCPPHAHQAEEECFVVLAGDGEALLGDDVHPIVAGSVLVRPPGTGVAHALRAGPSGMTYLAYGTRRPDEVVYYPRSKKLLVGGVMLRVEPVDYWDGE